MKGLIQFSDVWNNESLLYPSGELRPNSGFMYGRIRYAGCPGTPELNRLINEVRSGILNSIHTFANDPSRGVFILCFLLSITKNSYFYFFIYQKKYYK